MSVVNKVLLACLCGSCAGVVNAAPPPNDSFADRIVLNGSSVTFTGTLAGATIEPGGLEVDGYPTTIPNMWQSVWWEWTATASTAVTLQITDSSPRPYVRDGLVVYANVGPGFPANYDYVYGPSVAGVVFDQGNPWPCFSFRATNGTVYYILLAGSSGGTYAISLLATNDPIIIEQPRSFTVNTSESVLFTVMATGIRPLTYQWWFGDTLLAGQTNVMVAIDGATTNHAGSYFVVVSNATGVTTSRVATLTVTDAETKPSLAANKLPSSNQFGFGLFGENGRYYRIETSTDLKLWSAEQSFPMRPYSPWHSNVTSIIFNSDAATPLSVSGNAARRFVRASKYTPVDAICNSNLRQVRYAKFRWAWETGRTSSDSPADMELFPGTPSWRSTHRCPAGGVYNSDIVGNPPTCSITNHVLEEPR